MSFEDVLLVISLILIYDWILKPVVYWLLKIGDYND